MKVNSKKRPRKKITAGKSYHSRGGDNEGKRQVLLRERAGRKGDPDLEEGAPASVCWSFQGTHQAGSRRPEEMSRELESNSHHQEEELLLGRCW